MTSVEDFKDIATRLNKIEAKTVEFEFASLQGLEIEVKHDWVTFRAPDQPHPVSGFIRSVPMIGEYDALHTLFKLLNDNPHLTPTELVAQAAQSIGKQFNRH